MWPKLTVLVHVSYVTGLHSRKTNVRSLWRPKSIVIEWSFSAKITWTCQKWLLVLVSEGGTLVTAECTIHIRCSSLIFIPSAITLAVSSQVGRYVRSQLKLLFLQVTVLSCILNSLLNDLVGVYLTNVRIRYSQFTMTFGFQKLSLVWRCADRLYSGKSLMILNFRQSLWSLSPVLLSQSDNVRDLKKINILVIACCTTGRCTSLSHSGSKPSELL